MSEKPRLLFHSNAPFASTGYGTQTAIFTQRLKEHYDIAISSFFGLEGAVIDWQGLPVLPGVAGEYGDGTITAHADALWNRDRRKGLVLTLMDVWVLDPRVWRSLNVCSWVPVDHEPAPAPVVNFFRDSGSEPIAMSRFGQRMLTDAGLDPLYVPHGVDTNVYKPLPKATCRKKLNIPQDAFVVGMVAANKGNPSRKCFQEAFQAFKVFQEEHPEALLYLHSEMTGRFQGVNLPDLLQSVGVPLERVLFCDQYRAIHLPFPAETMARVFSSLDVLLSPSAGEGFGIAVLEANACGVPAIVSDFSAQPEVCGSGWTVEGTKWYTPIGSWQFRPDVEDILDALRQCYALPTATRKDYAKRGREHALEYDADYVVTEYFLPALQEVQNRYDALKPVEIAAA